MKQLLRLSSFFTFPAIVFLTHIISVTILDLYTRWPRLDIVFHYAGGLAIASTAGRILAFLETENVTPVLNRVLLAIVVIAFTATAAVVWEFAEFISDQLLKTDLQGSIANTMQDQLMGMLGGMTWAFLLYRRLSPAMSADAQRHLP